MCQYLDVGASTHTPPLNAGIHVNDQLTQYHNNERIFSSLLISSLFNSLFSPTLSFFFCFSDHPPEKKGLAGPRRTGKEDVAPRHGIARRLPLLLRQVRLFHFARRRPS